MNYYDCNIHLDQYISPISKIKENFFFGIKHLISLCDNLKSFSYLSSLIKPNNRISIGIGLHPKIKYNSYERDEILNVMKHEVKIIGECGIDKPENKDHLGEQIDNFKKQLKIAESLNKILILHVYKFEKQALDILDLFKLNKIIFHWYSGSVDLIKKIVDKGYYFSYNNCIIYYQKYQRLIEKIPINNILLESDAPYSFNGRITSPEDFEKITYKIAQIKSLKPELVNMCLNKNFESIFF